MMRPGSMGSVSGLPTIPKWRLGLVAGLVLAGASLAQSYTPPPPPLTVDPCVARPNPLLPADPGYKPPVCPSISAPAVKTDSGSAVPSTTEKFPFPGETAPAAKPGTAQQFPFPGTPAPAAPATPAKAAVPSSAGAADKFPYPGETSESPDAVPEGNTPRYVPDSPAPGTQASTSGDDASSSSSSSSSSGDAPAPTGSGADTPPDDVPTPGRRRSLPKVSAVSPDERVSEDLDVAKFYSDRGNFQAAYLRAKDATKVMPEDPDSHFVLAQAADRLKRKDEAAAEYALYLKLDPTGDKRTAAQRALSQLK